MTRKDPYAAKRVAWTADPTCSECGEPTTLQHSRLAEGRLYCIACDPRERPADPTAEQIAAECAVIRDGWTYGETLRRCHPSVWQFLKVERERTRSRRKARRQRVLMRLDKMLRAS